MHNHSMYIIEFKPDVIGPEKYFSCSAFQHWCFFGSRDADKLLGVVFQMHLSQIIYFAPSQDMKYKSWRVISDLFH